LLEGVVLLQQRIRNEDMGARWRGEGSKPIIVGETTKSAKSGASKSGAVKGAARVD
jgi:hypothetical protein